MIIEVVYAQPQHQLVAEVDLPAGACIGDVLECVARQEGFAELELDAHAVGVYGEVCARNHLLKPGDRVEIYRELHMDAKTARRKRAIQQASSK